MDRWISKVIREHALLSLTPRLSSLASLLPCGKTLKREEGTHRERARDYITNVRNIENVDETLLLRYSSESKKEEHFTNRARTRETLVSRVSESPSSRLVTPH